MAFTPLPENVRTALSEAYWDYRERVRVLLDGCSDDELKDFGLDPHEITDADWKLFDGPTRERFLRFHAIARLARRESGRAATPVIARGGIFCVFHGQDMALCAEEHFKNET